MRRLLPLCLLLATTSACARDYGPQLVDLQVVDRDQYGVLAQYAQRGERWVEGVPGHRYAVQLRNATAGRVLVVLSVDGVNAVSGQTAGTGQGGYVLEPWQSTEIAGWRKSLDDVAQFVFTDLPDSYAARTGRPDNIGVIGIAVFTERQPPVMYAPPPPAVAPLPEARNQAKAGAARREMADAAAQSIGTGHGQREWSPVGTTQFERDSRTPAQVVRVRYDDLRGLYARGIVPRTRGYGAPDPFPAGFVPDPPYGG